MLLDEPLIQSISSEAIKRISLFNSQCLSNTAWSGSVLEIAAGPVSAAIAVVCLRTAIDFDAQSLANLAWPLATGGRFLTVVMDTTSCVLIQE